MAKMPSTTPISAPVNTSLSSNPGRGFCSRTVFRVDASDGSGEYFLLENRQSLAGQSFDQGLFSEGLLVWQIDPDWIASRWGANRVNANAHMGVWLRQADGFDHLGSFRQPRGDGGDPFPGDANASAFHAGTSPASYSFQGGATGLTIQDIALSGDDVTFSLTTELTTISVSASGTTSPDGLFTLNGAPVDPPATTFRSAPFASNLIEASGGEAVSAGVRTSFLRWSDDPAAPRTRTVVAPLSDLDLVAEYGGTQYELAIDVTGGVSGVEPGTFLSSPTSSDLWFAPETEVVLQALPVAGFDFLRWTGDLAGQGNPASIVMTAPASATAEFEVVYGLASTVVDIPAAETQNVQLEVTEGTDPFLWYLVAGPLPEGILMSGSGRLSGAALDYGTYPVTVEVIDDNGLAATGSVTIEVSAPTIGIDALASEFLQTGPELTSLQKEFLDRQGNGVSGYDLGDFRAWLLANPSLELSASVEPAPATRTIVIPRRTPAGGEGNTP